MELFHRNPQRSLLARGMTGFGEICGRIYKEILGRNFGKNIKNIFVARTSGRILEINLGKHLEEGNGNSITFGNILAKKFKIHRRRNLCTTFSEEFRK